MDTALKAKWVEALRSGRYSQTKSNLKSDEGFCCLGVLCDIQGADFDAIRERYGTLSLSLSPPEYLQGIEESSKLAEMNDNGASFPEIADYIEANL